MRAELDDDYYVRNFLLVVDTVLERDEHLFDCAELEAIYEIKRLSEHELRLLVRLDNRRGPYFRLNRLNYPEIPNLTRASRSLSERGLLWRYLAGERGEDLVTALGGRPPLELEQVLKAFTVPELSVVANRLETTTGSRSELLAGLGTIAPGQTAELLSELGELIRLSKKPLLTRLQRLFFMNGHQDATTLVTTDLVLVRFPPYRVWRTRPVFRSREEFERYLQADALHDQFSQAVMARDIESAVSLGEEAFSAFLNASPTQRGFLSRYTDRHIHARTSLHFLRIVEARIDAARAAELYWSLLDHGLPERYRGRAWVRLALLRERSDGPRGGLEVCQLGLSDEATRGGERVDLLRRSRRLVSRLRRRGEGVGLEQLEFVELETQAARREPVREVVIRRAVVSAGAHRRMLVEGLEGDPVPVETAALEAYRAAGLKGLYTENTFFTTLFGLLFWDIVFGPVPDVFQSPYQDAPLDLRTETFFGARQERLEARLASIRSGDFRGLRTHHEAYFGMTARGVAWHEHTLEELEEGIERLGGARVAGIMEYLAKDYRRRHRGFPDLLLWCPRDAAGLGVSSLRGGNSSVGLRVADSDGTLGRASRDGGEGDGGERLEEGSWSRPVSDVWFAEVKSPRDRLSAEQRSWIEALRGLGFHVEVCRVEPHSFPP